MSLLSLLLVLLGLAILFGGWGHATLGYWGWSPLLVVLVVILVLYALGAVHG